MYLKLHFCRLPSKMLSFHFFFFANFGIYIGKLKNFSYSFLNPIRQRKQNFKGSRFIRKFDFSILRFKKLPLVFFNFVNSFKIVFFFLLSRKEMKLNNFCKIQLNRNVDKHIKALKKNFFFSKIIKIKNYNFFIYNLVE